MPYKDPEKSKLHARLRMRKHRLKESVKEYDGQNRRHRYASNKEKEKISFKEYRENNPEKYKARYILNNAIKQGMVERKPCERCGSINRVNGHHADYSKPFNVKWLCPKCHMEKDKRQPIQLACPMAHNFPELLI